MELAAFGLKEDGMLAQMLAAVVPIPDSFEVVIGPVALLEKATQDLETLGADDKATEEMKAELAAEIDRLQKLVMRTRFRGVESYTEIQDMTDKARQFEKLLLSGRVPAVKKELTPERNGDAAKAQFLAFFCLEAELQDPLPWLYLQKRQGLLFQYYFDEVSSALTLRVRSQATEAIEEKKGR